MPTESDVVLAEGVESREWNPLDRFLDEARRGSSRALGELLEGCRAYLLLVANEELGGKLRAKTGASDLVQETFLKAQAGLKDFHGTTHRDFLAWLRAILRNHLANYRRQFQHTDKRKLSREFPLDGNDSVAGPGAFLQTDSTSPSGQAARHEEAEKLNSALDGLPDDYRQVLQMRYRDQLSFEEIGRALLRSTDAARMMWWRAFDRLSRELEGVNGHQ